MSIKIWLFGTFLALILILSLYIKALKSDIATLENKVKSAKMANESLENSLKLLQKTKEQELKLLTQAHDEEKAVKEKIIKVGEYVYKNRENNLTTSFNIMLDELFE